MQRMQAIEAPIKNSWSFMLARTQLALMYFSLLDLLRAYYARVRASIYIYLCRDKGIREFVFFYSSRGLKPSHLSMFHALGV